MPTVPFQCGFCGQTAEVDSDQLGPQTRCPHCQRTAVAPEPVSGEPSAPFGNDWVAPPPCSSGPVAPRRESLFTVYLLIFLIPYSILVTLGAAWLYYQAQQVIHPLEMLPDWPRDNDPPARQSGTYSRVDDSQPLPERLRVALHATIRVGDLEVTPLQVERRPLVFRYDDPARPPAPSARPALVLTVNVRNLSDHVTFAPNDRFFNRRWRRGAPEANRPYTCLEVGARRFYGGPCPWRPGRRAGADPAEPQYVEGTACRTEVPPGGALALAVCTDPDDPAVLAAVTAAAEPLLWRVQLRRGLVRVRDKAGTATAVVGVTFRKSDIVSE
jgi:hypothetical protein